MFKRVNNKKTIKLIFFSLTLLILVWSLSSCQGMQSVFSKENTTVSQDVVPSVTVTVMQTLQPTFTSTKAPTKIPTKAPSVSPSPTAVASMTPTATWVSHQAGEVEVPIFLYHHISNEKDENRYYVTPKAFKEQMKLLHDLGYTTITATQLLDVLVHGGDLPSRPVMITFDDGHMSIYDTAFPIMEKYGFTGVFYIVANRLEADGFVGPKELKDLIDHGWEIGSHSMTHPDLTANHGLVRHELLDSKLALEDALNVKINTFAYPYGKVDAYVATKAQDYGYRGAMGLGTSVKHTWGTMYYLSRIEVYGTDDLDAFAAHLPFSNR